MFDSTGSAIILALVLLAVLVLGGAVGYALGKAQGRQTPLPVREGETEDLRSQLEQSRQELRESESAAVEYRTRVDGLSQELAYVKSQLAQAQQAEQIRLDRERLRAQAQEEEKRHRQAEALQEESKVLSALAPVQKNLDALQQKVSQIEEG
ncbi:MAG: DNA recombination protein RmuC, partial [Bifidobacteriales bacterium]|nr:DNA recombination protein RmuC [Bifidobacteriales bacterium]